MVQINIGTINHDPSDNQKHIKPKLIGKPLSK